MSIMRCESCNYTVDTDYDDMIYVHVLSGDICKCCAFELGCYDCGELKDEMKYCKVTDQYYCSDCAV